MRFQSFIARRCAGAALAVAAISALLAGSASAQTRPDNRTIRTQVYVQSAPSYCGYGYGAPYGVANYNPRYYMGDWAAPAPAYYTSNTPLIVVRRIDPSKYGWSWHFHRDYLQFLSGQSFRGAAPMVVPMDGAIDSHWD